MLEKSTVGYLKMFLCSTIISFILLFITVFYCYFDTKYKLQTDLLDKIQIVENNLDKKIYSYNVTVRNAVSEIKEKKLYDNKKKLFRFLEKLKQGQELISFKRLDKSSYSLHTDNKSYQVCAPVTLGHLCINELDLLKTYEDENIKIQFLKQNNRSSSNIFSLRITCPTKIIESFVIKGEVNYSKFKEIFIERALAPSLYILSANYIQLFILLFLQRGVYKKYWNVNKYLSVENDRHLSLHKFRKNLETKLYSTINTSKDKLYFILENNHMPYSAIINVIEDTYKCLSTLSANTSTSNISIDEIKKELFNVLNILGKTICANNIKLQFKLHSELNTINIDILNAQMILGSLVVESLTSLQVGGIIALDVEFFQDKKKKKNIYMQIELNDNSFCAVHKPEEIEHSSVFPTIGEMREAIKESGSVYYENCLYKGKKIIVKLFLYKYQNNVTSIFKK